MAQWILSVSAKVKVPEYAYFPTLTPPTRHLHSCLCRFHLK